MPREATIVTTSVLCKVHYLTFHRAMELRLESTLIHGADPQYLDYITDVVLEVRNDT